MAWRHAFSLVVLLVLAPMAGAEAQERFGDFVRPEVHGYRLDFCRHFARDCGQPAADLFCQQMGFEHASEWTPSGPVSVQTLVFGDGALCNGPNCSAFNTIRCSAGAPLITVLPQAVQVQPPPPPQVELAPPPQVELAPPPIADVPLPRARPESELVLNSVAEFIRPSAPALNAAFAAIASPAARQPLLWDAHASAAVANTWQVLLGRIGIFPEGASIYHCPRSDCEIAVDYDLTIDPDAADQHQTLRFSVTRVPHAGAVIWQVSIRDFPAFDSASAADLDPPGLVFSGRQTGVNGSYDFDFAVIGEIAATRSQVDGGTIFHVRALPASDTGLGGIVGQPSNVIRIYYGAEPPPPPTVEIFAPQIADPAPPVALVSLEFQPYRTITWPPGCLEWDAWRESQEKSFFEEVGGFFGDIWDFAAEAYQWAKDRAIDIASALTLGIVPDEVLAFALDAALASAGIPPNIPNLDEMINGGLDHLAGEIASVAVAQIPSGQLAGDLGKLAGDEIAAQIAQMGEEALRERLQQELEARSREALARTAEELERQASTAQPGALCEERFIPPSYRATVRNLSDQRIADAWVTIGDSRGVYLAVRQDFDLWPNQTLSLMLVPEPNIVDVWDNRLVRLEPMATSQNESNWWNEILFAEPSAIQVSLKGDLVCLGTCTLQSRQVLRSPPQLLTAPYYGVPMQAIIGQLINP